MLGDKLLSPFLLLYMRHPYSGTVAGYRTRLLSTVTQYGMKCSPFQPIVITGLVSKSRSHAFLGQMGSWKPVFRLKVYGINELGPVSSEPHMNGNTHHMCTHAHAHSCTHTHTHTSVFFPPAISIPLGPMSRMETL